MHRLTAAALLAATIVSAPAHAQRAPGATTTTRETTDPRVKHDEALAADAESAWARPPVDERTAVSRGQVTVRGQTIPYTATAGTLTIRDDAAKPIAAMFYTAYTREDAGRRRPVMFFWNGGPGSATIWLHMGSFAPVRVTTANPEYIRPAPYGFGPNPHSLIDKADLVFIDAVGAGWSRPLGDKKGADFYGVDQDADAFTRAIMRWVTKNNRWTSPKFIFGESYGTLRAGAVSYQLEQRGMSLNGVALLSSILNYGVRQPGYDQNSLTLFPSYAATAWYHNRLPNRPADLNAFLQQARAFANGPYAAALAKGSSLPAAERDQLAQQMSAMIGIPAPVIARADLRIDLPLFQTELLRDQRTAIGRLDSRYKLAVADANAVRPDEDPASTAISGAFIASFMDYVGGTLGYKTEMPYMISPRGDGWRWDFSHRAGGSNFPQQTPNTAVDLAATMRTNPYLKVLSLNGYYDMATPFYGIEFDIDHMLLPTDLRRNVEFKYYESGHMIYLNPDALGQLHDDVARWIDATVGAAASGQLPARPSAKQAGVRAPQ